MKSAWKNAVVFSGGGPTTPGRRRRRIKISSLDHEETQDSEFRIKEKKIDEAPKNVRGCTIFIFSDLGCETCNGQSCITNIPQAVILASSVWILQITRQ
ncbi:hypothetical protein L1987_80714 [Smallanthus sonchifolius]|uniref:Uncharacterized protein n=1 Tax=Smallanthus sonchifolius TaxID=185202 RepID=A0ACB8YQ08_9ASTR|nr:hypothetical protein L1987_80714 [Smallanthus sonchifolius]